MPLQIASPLHADILLEKFWGRDSDSLPQFSIPIMKHVLASTFGLLLLSHLSFAGITAKSPAPDAKWLLWYDQPAKDWNEALPLGNGHLGAMVFGTIPGERIQFNEYTIWTGHPRSYANQGASQKLPEIRKLLFEGKQKEAEDLAGREFMSIPLGQMAYQPCGDLWIDFQDHEGISQYRRWLDLDTATQTTEYETGGVKFRRETIISHPDRAMFVRLSSDQPGKINARVRLTSPHKESSTKVSENHQLILRGQVQADGIRFESIARVDAHGGSIRSQDGGLEISQADEVLIRLVAATNFTHFRDISGDPSARAVKRMVTASDKTWEKVLATHRADHQSLFRRMDINLGSSAEAERPTNLRIADYAKGKDPQLAALTFQYGRYLLIGSSRAGGQPSTLQGIWNDSLKPAWDSKYTCNINTQMNYWPAEPANLSECADPLFDALGELMASGRETAREHYSAPGWVLHHNFDLWRGTAPINASDHGIWPTGGAWLCHQLWERYLYSKDETFLREKAYPILRDSAEFFTHYLIEDPVTQTLISGPSNSPEQGGLVMGPSMDHQIIRSLFKITTEAAGILKTDKEFAAKLAEMTPRISPNRIGKHGQLQEWMEDRDDPNNKHRHVSHLWAVYPGTDITSRDVDFFKAARQSLLHRGDEATGWSMGWKINLWARFLDGDHAHVILRNLLRPVPGNDTMDSGGGMYPNLFDAHPPFQIDGNFGAAAGIGEMIVQSHLMDGNGNFIIDVLPALPSNWPVGSIRGIRARGGFELDLEWKDGKPLSLTLRSKKGGTAIVRNAAKTREIQLAAGGSKVITDWQP
jgi:alpha-L-fucosidase 2